MSTLTEHLAYLRQFYDKRHSSGWETLAVVMCQTHLDELEALNTPPQPAPSEWSCAARKQSLPEPADCDWPKCGCDPYAEKVIAALEEASAPTPSDAVERVLPDFATIYADARKLADQDPEYHDHDHYLALVAFAAGRQAQHALSTDQQWVAPDVTEAMIEAGVMAWPSEDDPLFDTEEDRERDVVRRILTAALSAKGMK